jgi:small-conductance mechanosensitive channel
MRKQLYPVVRWIFFILILWTGPVLAQTEASEQAVDTAAAEAPKAIPTQDLIQKIEEAVKETKVIGRKIEVNDEVIRLDTLLPEYVKFIQQQIKLTDNFVKSNPNRQKINNQIKKWNGFDEHLTQWESQLDQYSERNIKILERVKINEQIWKLTYENIRDQNIPKEVARRVKETYDDTSDLHKQIVSKNNDYLILESRINKQKLDIAAAIERLEKLKESEIYGLFYLRHEPLWKSDYSDLSKQSDQAERGTEFDQNITESIKYAKYNFSRIFRYLFYVALFVFLIRWIRRIFEKYPYDDPDKNLIKARDTMVNQSMQVIIFTSLLGLTYFLENRPTLLNDILHLLILVASIPLVRPFMRGSYKNILYFVILIFIMDTVKTYIWFSSLQYRLYLMLEAVLVILLLYWYGFRNMRALKFKEHFFGALLLGLAPLFQLIALISIVSNLLGYTNLTDLTLKISTKTGVYAVISYALFLVLGGISIGIIHNHFESREMGDSPQKKVIERKSLNVNRFIVVVFWLLIILSIIDMLTPLNQYLLDILTEPYVFGSITITVGDILTFLLILTVSFMVTSMVSFFIDSGQFKSRYVKLPKGIPAAISLVIRYFIIATGIILALSSLGVDLSKFNLMAGALGLGIGFGLQNVISNFVSGLILVFERPILVGDTVEVNNLMGTVKRIGVRSSNISTFDGAEVVVPNSNLISNDLINWTLSSNLKRIEILIGVAYGTNPNEVLKILKDVVHEAENVLKQPEPQILFSDFGDSSLNFRVRFWVPFERGLQAKSDISIAIYNAFEEKKIEIPFPQRDIHIKSVPPESGEDGNVNTDDKLNPPT